MQASIAATAALLGCRPSPSSQAVSADEPTDKPAIEYAQNEILMLVYPRFTALDLIGPQHVFALLGPEYKTRLVWKDRNIVTSDTGVPFRPTMTFEECPANPAVLFIPGGTDGTIAAMEDPDVRAFVTDRGSKARYVTSVCTGAMVLGAAGLLDGYKATTHWLALDSLKLFGSEPVAERVVEDRNRLTGGGVTAGIDFALTLTSRLQDEAYARAVQLMMEYDPQPPFGSGNPSDADPETVQMLQAMAKPFLDGLTDTARRILPSEER